MNHYSIKSSMYVIIKSLNLDGLFIILPLEVILTSVDGGVTSGIVLVENGFHKD